MLDVALANDLPERKHAVVVRQVQCAHCRRIRCATVMGVVKQRNGAAARNCPANLRDEPRIVPLVHEHHARTVDSAVQIERLACVEATAQLGIDAAIVFDRDVALLRHQISPAPTLCRLVDVDGVTAMQQLADDAAQEMRVAVIPIRCQRMTEEDELHRCSVRAARWTCSRVDRRSSSDAYSAR